MAERRKTNGALTRKLRAYVLRTQSVCAWCGQPVDKTLPPLDPKAPQVDHIRAVANGGSEYDRTNLQLMHRRCNREKWHRDVPVDLGTSRSWW